MAYLPPRFRFLHPPPPRRTLSSPPPPPWRRPPSPPSNHTSSSSGAIVAIIVIAVVASPLVLIIVCHLCYRNSSAAAAARPRPPPRPRDDEIQIHSRASDARPPRASPTAGLPAFTYSRSVKHNVTGGGEEAAATCSVCLGAFQLGETVRLLPVCLHLYHVECIDPWLDAHSTCPLCRSDTDPTMGVGRLPPA